MRKLVEEQERWDRTDYYYLPTCLTAVGQAGNESWQVLEERLAAGVEPGDKNVVASAVKTQYLWDVRYIDAPVCRWRDDNGDGDFDDPGEHLYYLNDANTCRPAASRRVNVTAVVDGTPGSQTLGEVLERYAYDPYGRPTFLTAGWTPSDPNASACANDILYCGYRFDPETRLYNVRNRLYHSDMGVFTSRDLDSAGAPVTPRIGTAGPALSGRFMPRDQYNVFPAVPTPAPHPDGPSLYQYVRSNPIRYTDSSGLAVDPGKDCELWSRSKWTGFIGPIKKPAHFWLNSDAGELWDFGPDIDWLRDRYGHTEYEDSTIAKYCRGQANWGPRGNRNAYAHATGAVNKRPKLQLLGLIWYGSGKGKSCECASCGDIKDCLSEVRRRWDGTRYDHFARHCGSLVLDAATWCCLWGV